MSDVVLEDTYHLPLVFWWIFFEVFYERKEVCIAFLGDISCFDEFEDVVVALELFFSSVYRSLISLFVFCIRLVVDSCIGHVGGRVFLFEGELEAETVGLDELKLIGSEGREETLESFREVVTRILVDGCRIEIHEEVLESEFLHTFHGGVRISIGEIFSELRYEAIVVVTRAIVVDEVGEECPDSVDSGSIFFFPWRIENGFVESREKSSCFSLESDRIGLWESELGQIGSHDFTQNLLDFSEWHGCSEVALEDFSKCRVLNLCERRIEECFFWFDVECSEYGEIIGMRGENSLFLGQRSILKFVEPRIFEVRPSMRYGREEEIRACDDKEEKSSKEANDIPFIFPVLRSILGHVPSSDEDREEECEVHGNTVPHDSVCRYDEEKDIETCKDEIQEKEFGFLLFFIQSEREIHEGNEGKERNICISSWESFWGKEFRKDAWKFRMEEIHILESEHRNESNDPERVFEGEKEEDNRNEHEIERRDFRIFSRLIRLHSQIKGKLQVVIYPIFVPEIAPKVFILCFPAGGNRFHDISTLDLLELFRSVYFRIIWHEEIPLSGEYITYNIPLCSGFAQILHHPRRYRESDSEEKYEWYDKGFFKGTPSVLIKGNTKRKNSNSEWCDGHEREELYIVFRVAHIELCPESEFGEYPYKEREVSDESRESEFRVEDNSQEPEYKHERRELDCESKSHDRPEYEDIGEIFMVCKKFEGSIVFVSSVEILKTFSVPEEEVEYSIDSDDGDKEESRIEFHVFCLLKYHHRHRIEGGRPKEWKIEKALLLSFSGDLQEVPDSYHKNNEREDSSDLIQKECLWSWVEHETDSREDLPSHHPDSFRDFSVVCHNLRIVHVHSEIIPPNRHRTNNVDKIDRYKKCEDKEKNLRWEKGKVYLLKEIPMRFMIGKFDFVGPKAC